LRPDLSRKAETASFREAAFGTACLYCPLAEGFQVVGADFDVLPFGIAAWPGHAVIVSYPAAGGLMEREVFVVDASVGVDDESVGMGLGPFLVFFVVPIEADDGFWGCHFSLRRSVSGRQAAAWESYRGFVFIPIS
jgi:hypothetical protein